MCIIVKVKVVLQSTKERDVVTAVFVLQSRSRNFQTLLSSCEPRGFRFLKQQIYLHGKELINQYKLFCFFSEEFLTQYVSYDANMILCQPSILLMKCSFACCVEFFILSSASYDLVSAQRRLNLMSATNYFRTLNDLSPLCFVTKKPML